MLVLGIESSCDDTGIGIYETQQGLLTHCIYSQISTHAKFGGVVPELASRDHIQKVLPLLEQALKQASIKNSQLDGIAYTKGPGLIGSLMVGATVARSLGFALNIPTLGIHHLEAHILAVMLETKKPTFPFVALLVSGGHTMLIEVQSVGNYQILGETLDDAVGEAFDKTAKLLGLPYPGGAALAALAIEGDPTRFEFPRPMVNQPGLNFSFSGLKTAAMQCYKNHEMNLQTKADIACAFEEAIIDTLTIKCNRALEQTGLNTLVVAGGVGANKKLRERLSAEIEKKRGHLFFPRAEFCVDNGAMVAYAGHLRLSLGQHDNLNFDVKSRWPLQEF